MGNHYYSIIVCSQATQARLATKHCECSKALHKETMPTKDERTKEQSKQKKKKILQNHVSYYEGIRKLHEAS